MKPPPPTAVGNEGNESSSVLTRNCEDGGGGEEIQVASSSSISLLVYGPWMSNPYYSDMPLFTPNSANLFCSSKPLYRYADSVVIPSNMGELHLAIIPLRDALTGIRPSFYAELTETERRRDWKNGQNNNGAGRMFEKNQRRWRIGINGKDEWLQFSKIVR
ncbi:hypothetical protein NE237_033075 [Protea cynaroides]|uniref:Uncharacterized protein n=1 Tax=Protea cynaroides TaxID=273540 RepID=A0A9Q0L477_9MAGN|nr:hypothetical protein NE237_033075 [Protea cynaroides]